jgi:histidinol dehydrogenase
VEHFLKKSSLIMMSGEGIEALGEACALLAKTEGLTAHERSVRIRLEREAPLSRD